MTRFVKWQSYELLRGDAAGKPIMALMMSDEDGETVYRLSLDQAIELGQSLATAAAVLCRG